MAEKSLEAHFIKCLKEGNTKKALYIVELLGDKINNLYRGKSPLLWAKEFENDEVASVLEEKGAVEEAISDEEAEKLGIELVGKAKVGDFEAVIELIEKGAKVDEKDKDGETALIWASFYGNLRIAEKLIESRTDVNQKDGSGWSALMFASNQGYLGIVELLIEEGADVNQKNKDGNTVLMLTSQFSQVKIVKRLIEEGADVNLKNDDGKTAISLAKDDETRRVILEAVKKRKEKTNEKEPSFMEKMKGLFGKGE